MIPYLVFTTVSFGPFTIHVWGAMAALGFLVATIVAAHRAREMKLNVDLVWSASWQIVLASMVGARLFEVLFYEPRYYIENPGAIFSVWNGGMSSYGGIIGGTIALMWFIRRNKLSIFPLLDIVAYAAPLGFVFGRIGCFLIHDHPGTLTSFIGGVRYPDGVRHDGGLEMAIADGLIFLVMIVCGRKNSFIVQFIKKIFPELVEGERLRSGSFVLLFLALKGLSRFWLDFYRATDLAGSEARYAGLTPSQYVGLISMLVFGYALLYRWQFRQRS